MCKGPELGTVKMKSCSLLMLKLPYFRCVLIFFTDRDWWFQVEGISRVGPAASQ